MRGFCIIQLGLSKYVLFEAHLGIYKMSTTGLYFIVKDTSIPTVAGSRRAIHKQIQAALAYGFTVSKNENVARVFDCSKAVEHIPDMDLIASEDAELGDDGAKVDADPLTIDEHESDD